MSDSDKDPLSSLLSSFALGPSWARAAGDKLTEKPKAFRGGAEDGPRRRDDRDRGPRQGGGGGGGGPRDRDDGGRRPFQRREDRHDGPPRQQEAGPEEGVRVTIAPDPHAVHLIGKEVHQVARVYALFDVAKILLAEKARCRAIFEAPEPHAPLVRGKLEDCVFLTREEAVRHLWASEKRQELLEEETIEVDPPSGNFQAIARCGVSGEWLGPVNFHSYQTNLRRLHRERFARMPFELYASKVRTERGEDAVNAWLETMKSKTRWRIKGDDDDSWIDDRAAAEKAFATRCFDSAFEETRVADVTGAIAPANLSPSLLMSLKIAGTHARNHPAILIPSVCRAVEAEHLPVFKRQGKLFTGPARPHPLAADAILAERPGQMVGWIRENKPAKLEGLWKSVLPEGSTAPPSEYAADLFWLLHQGHILLFTDDLLVVQEVREAAVQAPAGEGKKKKKKKKKKPTAEGEGPEAGTSEAAETDSGTASSENSQEANPPSDSATTESSAEAAAPSTESQPGPEITSPDSAEPSDSTDPSVPESTASETIAEPSSVPEISAEPPPSVEVNGEVQPANETALSPADVAMESQASTKTTPSPAAIADTAAPGEATADKPESPVSIVQDPASVAPDDDEKKPEFID